MPVPPVIQMYRYVMGSGGGVSNLLQGSEQLGSTGVGRWNQNLMNAVNSDQVNNPAGTEQTADQLDFQADRKARIIQDVTLVAGTEYTFSVWARAASGTQDFRLSYWDNVGRIFGTSAHTASATWSPTTGRYSFTFTAATSGTFSMYIQNAADDVSRRIYFWGAMLNVGGAAADYIKTEFTGPSSPATPPMEFGDNFAGVTAYYSLRRFTRGADNNAIRVRRSSDDTEQDIGFDSNGDLDTTALTTFVNADVDTHTSDFSSGTDGWFANGGTADGNIDGISDGTTSKDDVLRLTLSGGATNHSVRLNGAIGLGNVHDVSFEYYIPSGQTLDGIKFQTNSGLDGNYQQSVAGTWTSVTISDWSITGGDQFRVYGTDGGSITIDADGDVFYLKNIIVTQTTADGAVSKWYDQSGNSNDAINADASAQPLVVSGGSVVTENGKAGIDFDGVDDNLLISSFTSTLSKINSHSTIILNKSNTNTGNLLSSAVDTNDRFTIGYNSGYLGIMIFQNPFLRNSTSSSNAFGSQTLISNYFDTTSANTYVDNVQVTTQTSMQSSSVVETTIGSRNGGGIHLDGNMQEIIIFNSDQSSNRTGIETNINDHFDIYTP